MWFDYIKAKGGKLKAKVFTIAGQKAEMLAIAEISLGSSGTISFLLSMNRIKLI